MELDVDEALSRVCHACLSFVSFPLADGETKVAKREARRMAPVLWDEGLAEPALAAVREAVQRGVPGASRALDDLEASRGRSHVAHAIVLRLASELDRRTNELYGGFTLPNDQGG